MPELRGKPAIDSFLEKIKQAMGQDHSLAAEAVTKTHPEMMTMIGLI